VGTTWTNSGTLYVGYDQSERGNGNLTIQSGAHVSSASGYISYYGGTHTATVDGTGSQWVNSGNLSIGYLGYSSLAADSGSLYIQNGGEVDVNGSGSTGAGTLTIGCNSPGGAGTYSLQIGNATSAGILKAAIVTFGSRSTNSLVFDHNSLAYIFSPVISGAGTIVHEGTGTTILTGTSNAFTGTTSITNGALLVAGTLGNSTSAVTVSNGRIGGSGTLSGPVTLNSGGLLSPGGDGGASLLTAKLVTWNGGGGMVFHLGTTSALLTVTGALTKGTAGTYNIDFENAGAITAGTTYNLIAYGSTTFTASNFTYTSSLAGFSGAFSISGNILKFTVQALSPVVAPVITSAHNASFPLGQADSFTFTATGNSAPTFSATGLPSWASLNATTGLLSGTPPNATGSPFTIALTASNGATPNATQTFTLTVVQSPAITSAANTTFTAQSLDSFTFTATGSPAPTFSATGLPSWATLDANTGVLSGTPPDATGSPFTINLTASNGVSPAATQAFALTVQPLETPPTFTSASATTFASGQPGGFVVEATGNPAPTFSATGLPSWATLDANTGVLSGTPPDATGSPFTINLTAANGNTPNATQILTLTVTAPPVIATDTPTLPQWGLGLLAFLLMGVAAQALPRRFTPSVE
jgi:T5SS/PEP-CTERM-associated repeat protein/autotransporter-associated beta strand protein